jgi:signal transduction histidine kinase
MRKKIILSFLILFFLFTAGAGITMLSLYKTTSDLQTVINLHRVEIVRQDLVIRAQTVQSHLYSFGTAFGPELDVIVDNVIELDGSAKKCLQCHHNPQITRELTGMVDLMEQYEDALSYLITTSANPERIERLRLVAIGLGDSLLNQAQEMTLKAGQKLSDKTFRSMKEIQNSRFILIFTLALSFVLALVIAVSVTRGVTGPINELVGATRRIKAGDLGYTTPLESKDEFGELATAFNEMSLSLGESNKKILRHLHNLSNLYSLTLAFHSLTNEKDLYRELAHGVADLVGAEQCGLLIRDAGEFVHVEQAVGLTPEEVGRLRYPEEAVETLCEPEGKRACIFNERLSSSPLWEAERDLEVKNLMLVWVRQKEELVGAIRVANKQSGPFTEEDIRPLAILTNNLSVAMENARLYDDLRRQMQELQDAQEQLIQASKLVAIGELASNVAHELNNPLTSVLGYAELIKEEKDFQGVLRDIDVIERESLRAREIVRQLLEFARKRSLTMEELDINCVLKDVIELVHIQIRDNHIDVCQDYQAAVPIKGDKNQLKQVLINLTNNAIFAMEKHGVLGISTWSDPTHVYVKVSDTGVGIPPGIRSRIFDPFFSTKKEKGTGIGLSISYKIVQSHGGRIEVESEESKGSAFTIVLPVEAPPPDTTST